MKIGRRARVILATVIGESLLRCKSKIVQSEMFCVHNLCKMKYILFIKGGNFPNTPKPSIGKSREPLSVERPAQKFGSLQKETPRLPSRVFRNDRLKATIFLSIKWLAQMRRIRCSRASLPSALTQFLAVTC
jgi:hypothetical protein